jgi:hypothetical protein
MQRVKTTRREFLVRSLAASAFAACPIAGHSLFAGGAPEAPGVRLRSFRAPAGQVSKVLFDRDFPVASAFAAEASRRGVPAFAVGDDAGGVWIAEIEPLWRRGTGAIAGLTRGVPLFCLELLARDYGMAVVHRARHPACAGTESGAAAAALAFSSCEAPPPPARIDLVDLTNDGRAERPLFSWVIAPADVSRALAGRRP